MKTSDDRIEFAHHAAAIAMSESGDVWVSFGARAFLSKVNAQCDEVLRVPVQAKVRAIDRIEDGGVALLLSGSRDLWRKSGGRTTTIVSIASDGGERSRLELAETFASGFVALPRRFVLMVDNLATTVTPDGAVQQLSVLANQLSRAPGNNRVWAITRWRMVSLSAAQPTPVMALALGDPYELLGLAATQSGAWLLSRSFNLGTAFVLRRLVPQRNPVGYLPAPTIVVERVLPWRPVAVASTASEGAWVLFEDGAIRRYDATGAEEQAIEFNEPATKPRAIACNDAGTEVGALFESKTGSLLRRASVARE